MHSFSRHAIKNRLRAMEMQARAFQVRLRSVLGVGRPPLRLLLISDGESYTSEQQFAPIFRHAGALQRHYGLVVTHHGLEQGLGLSPQALRAADIVGLKLNFKTRLDMAERFGRHFRQALQGASTCLVYFDGDDDLCIQWPGLLQQVDVYVKKQIFTDQNDYLKRYLGKSNLTDYVARHHGKSFDSNFIAASGPVDEKDLSKLYLGWNIALDDKIAQLASESPPAEIESKDIDVGSRASVSPDVWIHPLRDPAVNQIGIMANRYRVLAPRERVNQEQYYQELRRARICVSPFGYGELCWRDFEAVLSGCLLVKPNMGHVRTYPDIFVAGQTYAPVKWDYSNLEAVCERYLRDEDERKAVAGRAYAALCHALQEDSFVDTFGQLLARIDSLRVP